MRNCINCGENKWRNVDEFRVKPSGMCLCMSCGFVTYPERFPTEADAKAYYEKQYRGAPQSGNFFSSEKKMFYHSHFLNAYLQELKKKEDVVICDIGAAMGMFLHLCAATVPNATIKGTEWGLACRRNAMHEYGVRLDLDFDTSLKYDLISLYMVAEHQPDFDKNLRSYRDCIKDDGILYLSAPTWFNCFFNQGPANCDLEYYYHPDHINVWTRPTLKNIIERAGFEIIKHNTTVYGDTYIVKKCDVKDIPIHREDPKEIMATMLRIKQSHEALLSRDPSAAISFYPNNPIAWRGQYEMTRQKLDYAGIEEIKEFLNEALVACPNSVEIMNLCAEIYQRYELYDHAIKILDVSTRLRPAQSECEYSFALCYRGLYSKTGDISHLVTARDAMRGYARLSTQNIPQALGWIYAFNSDLEIDGI